MGKCDFCRTIKQEEEEEEEEGEEREADSECMRFLESRKY
jgi:hypothetical protein